MSRLSLENDAGAAISSKRIRLLEMIGELGSISQAAKAVPLSYKAAWDAIEQLNSTAAQPLVERTSGGRQGGGTQLTEYGRRMTVMYRALEQAHQTTLDRLLAGMDELQQGDLKDFQQLMHRTAIKTSARNNFCGQVTGLKSEGVNYLVHLQLEPGLELLALITQASAANLGLAMGSEVFALFKAFSVNLSKTQPTAAPATNQLEGQVTNIIQDQGQVEIAMGIAEKQQLTAVVSQLEFTQLGLKLGDQVYASFPAEQIILATYN
ncbi:TOBE domain-containing protein [Marinospirillum insulare]|uniref:TOBE domain-containing protein n=1 Tax=Marinospirillum insulare TaxID=217169 RepID=UPI001B808A46|nr:TOBE domain-containing protein [Marinospirillum insulare]